MQMLIQSYFQLTAVHSTFIIYQESTKSFFTDLNGGGVLENVLL